jgi:hypothetical protein
LRVRRRDAFFNAAYRSAAGLLSGSDTGDALFGPPRLAAPAAAADGATGGGSRSGGRLLKRRTLSTYSIQEHPAATDQATGQTRRFAVQVRF